MPVSMTPNVVLYDANFNRVGNTVEPIAAVTQGEAASLFSSTTIVTGLADGSVTTGTTGSMFISLSSYAEQTTNFQGSVVSSSANDTSAGTGARTIKITYYDQTGAGPNTETLTMNGVSNVNTVGTNLCFIEKIEVITVGTAGGNNAGDIQLKNAINGGGSVVIKVMTGWNRTFMAQHYVATGKTCYVKSVIYSNKAGSALSVRLKTTNPTSTTSPETQVGPAYFMPAGAYSETDVLVTPISLAGPGRIRLYAQDPTASDQVFGAFEWMEK